MGNNKEIRQRMETYRSILLVFNWIAAIVLIIVGFVLANSRYTQGIGIGVIIGSIVIGVIGHFLINVTLAIPFILLNNGDYLATIAGTPSEKTSSDGNSDNKGNNNGQGNKQYKKSREQVLNDPMYKNHLDFIRKTKGEDAFEKRIEELCEPIE